MSRTTAGGVAALLAICVAMPLAAQKRNPTDIVMKVNDQPVYAWEVGLVIPQVQADLIQRGIQPEQETILTAAMKRVADTRLLAQEARRRGLKPDERRVDGAIAQMEQQGGGREGLDAALANLGVTRQQLRASVAEADLVQVLISSEIDPNVEVSLQEIQSFYIDNARMFEQPEMVRARHILFRVEPQAIQAAKDMARSKATATRQRAVAGEDFAALATELSEGPNASKGGDLGFFAQEQMVPALANAAFALGVGDISAVVETQFGFHILKLEEKRAASKISYEEAKERIEQVIRENKGGELVAALVAELNQSATIVDIEPPADEAGGDSGS